jgi:hypothetical protein
MNTRPYDQAFPWVTGDWSQYEPEMREGLSKRELFAAMMCAGDAANLNCQMTHEKRAEWSVTQADALIAALNKEEGPSNV